MFLLGLELAVHLSGLPLRRIVNSDWLHPHQIYPCFNFRIAKRADCLTGSSTSVALPEPDGPKSTLICVGKRIGEANAWVLFSANTDPLSSPNTITAQEAGAVQGQQGKVPAYRGSRFEQDIIGDFGIVSFGNCLV